MQIVILLKTIILKEKEEKFRDTFLDKVTKNNERGSGCMSVGCGK